MTIPVIDFSKLEGEERIETLSQIANGCEEWGFFQLVNHGVPVELLQRVKNVCSECYELREEEFKKSKPVQLLDKVLDQQGQEGHSVEQLENVDWEDVFFLHDDNDWPSNPPQFIETMKEYRREVKKLAERVMEVMEENLRLAKGQIKKTFSCNGQHEPFFGTKVSHYPPCPRLDLVAGLRAHTDAGGVILLSQDDRVGGLQILKDGLWVDVQPVANAIVINTGDQIEVMSNGRYKSVWHRVVATGDGNRQSVASFYNPSFKATIAPVVSEEEKEVGGSLYPKLVFGDYMDVYAKQKFLPKETRFEAVGGGSSRI
ncbi:1-aminocyclopropane-1-carboxylate oxidase-like [Typha angustifolia]|uniref:1-aminocyclopropane-1-carboxylate oxidase-like n=1 Tax=Typha angustifolia TaxID=59011 RepID=UPI003C2E427F